MKATPGDKNYFFFAQNIGSIFFNHNDFGISEELKDLLTMIFDKDPANRPSIIKIWKHPWMRREYDLDATKAEIQSIFEQTNYENLGLEMQTFSDDSESENRSSQ